VRHASRLFAIAARLRVPFFTIVLRRGYGLGAQAMAGGHFHAGAFTVSWPTGEFGAMGLEGAVRLSLKKQLEALPDDAARDAMVAEAVAVAYERGKAISMASYLELDGVIDPADTRAWLVRGMKSVLPPEQGRRFIDTW
jgi:acetyl-CoA carboxylase carboxyltransferase component